MNAVIFSAPNVLTSHLAQKLERMRVEVHVSQSIKDLRNISEVPNYLFVIFNIPKEIETLIKNPFTKTCIILPLSSKGKYESLLQNRNVTIVYVGDLKENIKQEKIEEGEDYKIYFQTDAGRLGETIIKNIFGFGFGKNEVILGENIKIKTEKPKEKKPQVAPQLIKPILISQEKPKQETPKKESKKTKSNKFIKSIALFCVVCFWLVVTPFIFLLISVGALFIFRLNSPQALFVSQKTASFAKDELIALSNLPVVGIGFNSGVETASLLEKGSSAFLHLAKIENLSTQLGRNITGNTDYDLPSLSENLTGELNSIYQDASFLTANIQGSWIIPSFLKDKIDNYKDIIPQIKDASTLTSELPQLLGNNKQTTYLVLFQNNSELRPTGGFIGSYALVSFENGKLVDMPLYDIYSADGQLEGHIDPPLPIKNYLGEANWWFRDSNWDPDFPVSAIRGEWFLDKEMNRSVDGVVAIDLEVLKSFLSLTGPIQLSDLNEEVDAKNFVQKIQFDVESNFFPGSHQKADLLTALSRSLILKLKDGEISGIQKSQAILDNLNSRDIQVYLHNKNGEDAINALSWGGAYPNPVDQGTSQNILVSAVEANLGVNKANYFIKRTANLTQQITQTSIQETLTINFENTAAINSNISSNYKNYIRIFANNNATFQDKSLTIEDLGYARSAGTLISIPAGTKKSITFAWSVPLKPSTNLINLNLRKQAGVEPYPLTVEIVGQGRYNTYLSKDLNYETNIKGR